MSATGKPQSGIYVEILIQETVDRIWQLTQTPALHQRWDLRFDRIEYLPRPDPNEPQLFLYETRIGFGLTIKGTGETVGVRSQQGGDTTSALKFQSEDPKSLIRQGSGYWRYVPTSEGLRFFTWYDYQSRFGALGRTVDRFAFRPLIGWATAWSFDRLRLWAELGQSPESSMTLAIIHAIARISLAFVWIWHGLIPKLIFRNNEEQILLRQSGLSLQLLPWIGAIEIVFGCALLLTWERRSLFLISAALMLMATLAVAVKSPAYIQAAFNPVTLNLAVFTLSIAGWLASISLPSASRCLRKQP